MARTHIKTPRVRWWGSPIAIDIGAHSIKALQVSYAIGGTTPRAINACAILPRKEPEAHELNDDEVASLAAVLRRQGFSGRDVAIAVPWTMLLTGILDLPPRSSGAPIEQLARMELARMNRCDPASFEMACWELPPACARRGPQGTSVMVAACPHLDAGKLIDLFEAHGLSVDAIDVGTLAAARACISMAPGTDGGLHPIIDLGHSAARLALLHKGVCVYARAVPEAALSTLHAKLAAGLSADRTVTRYLIEDVGLSEDAASGRADPGALADARSAIAEYAAAIVRELNLSTAYAMHRYPDMQTTGFTIYGGGAMIPGLPERLAEMTDLNVHAADPTRVAGATPRLAPRAARASLMIALGLTDRTGG